MKPGAPEVFEIQKRDAPVPRDGWVTVRVKAFGLNRSEMFTRQGHSPSVQFPRVLGIECVGEVLDAPQTRQKTGQQVIALMGGMGREFDGGYAEIAQLPERCVFPVETSLDWTTLGALPEMFQTAWGILSRGLALSEGDQLLIRGGTSSVGLMALRLAKIAGATVTSTTRSDDKKPKLKAAGADEVIIDNGRLGTGEFDKVLDLVGTTSLQDSMNACRAGGITCMAGILGNAWTLENFLPMEHIPHCVRLTVYSGGPGDLDLGALQQFIKKIESGETSVDIDKVFALEEIAEAHARMENNQAQGKLVVDLT
ncbi:MAG: zinc-binding dehydrogenase [Pseudomonadota bacterium]